MRTNRARGFAFAAFVAVGVAAVLVPAGCREVIGLDAYRKVDDSSIVVPEDVLVDTGTRDTFDAADALDTFDATPSNPCFACIRSLCAEEYDKCIGDPECPKYLSCFDTCPKTCDSDSCFCRCTKVFQVGKVATTLAVCVYLELTAEAGLPKCFAGCGPAGDAAIPDYGVICDGEADSGRCR